MKYFICIVLFFFVVSCRNRTTNSSNNSAANEYKNNFFATDSILKFYFVTNFSHQKISNKSDRQIDLLFNSIADYLGGQRNNNVHFSTECMSCEPIQEYMGGLLFAKRLLITIDQIEYFNKDFDIPDSLNCIKFNTDGLDGINPEFQFSDGKGNIKYIGVSCNDAGFYKVRLKYPTGEIVIDSLINASFFEYDLNSDGHKEQYLLGSRNCSQEFIILQIRKNNDKFDYKLDKI